MKYDAVKVDLRLIFVAEVVASNYSVEGSVYVYKSDGSFLRNFLNFYVQLPLPGASLSATAVAACIILQKKPLNILCFCGIMPEASNLFP